MAQHHTHEVLIVGAGPIGLELAVSLTRAGVDYVQLEAGQVGQTITWYPNDARFFSSPERISIAGVPLVTPDQGKASREQYLAYLRGIVEQFDLQVNTYERVTAIEKDPATGRFSVRSERADGEHVYDVGHLVLAIGDMHHPRRLNVPGEELDHVTHYFDDPHWYFRRRLLIVGGKNSAVEAAIRCCRAGAHVAMSYRRAGFSSKIKYWLLPELQSLIKAGHIAFYPCTVPTQITPTHVTLTPSKVDDPPADRSRFPELRGATWLDEPTDVPADAVQMLTGYTMDPTLLEMAGVTLEGENRAPKLDEQTMMSDVEHLYVAGTAAAGTQVSFKLFIENSHAHVAKIIKSITGAPPEARYINALAQPEMPES
jgi:thioredoxin reductase (NADPH)